MNQIIQIGLPLKIRSSTQGRIKIKWGVKSATREAKGDEAPSLSKVLVAPLWGVFGNKKYRSRFF